MGSALVHFNGVPGVGAKNSNGATVLGVCPSPLHSEGVVCADWGFTCCFVKLTGAGISFGGCTNP